MKNKIKLFIILVGVFFITGCSGGDGEVPILISTSFTVDKNTAVSTVIGSVQVSSIGDSSITSYTLSSTSNLSISSSGELSINTPFDYETSTSHSLSVYATNSAGNSQSVTITINIDDEYEVIQKRTPTLVVGMNWDNYSETDALIWSEKIFGSNDGQLNAWFHEATNANYVLVPATETQGTANDGIIFVDMGKSHVGGSDDTDFKITEIKNAISSAAVNDNIDFSLYDTDSNGAISNSELQIVFLVAGGEESVGDSINSSIWAHAWSYAGSSSTFNGVTTYSGGVFIDGVYLMNAIVGGGYTRFGANHGNHKATIGVIAHEVSHSLLDLDDFYDNSGGSGLGWYDIMSGGTHASKSSDSFSGETPTQYSAFNKLAAGLDLNVSEVSSSVDLTISCSDTDLVKLNTSLSTEYFLLECRDTAKINSDMAFNRADNSFSEDRLFAVLYHVDTEKSSNHESGVQTSSNHYRVALVEKDTNSLMTSSKFIYADFNDVYVRGDTIGTTATSLYDGTVTNYSIEVTNENYTDRTMTFSIRR